MGSNYSYLKIYLPGKSTCIGIVFEKHGLYKHYIIEAGNGKNIKNEYSYVSYNFYYKYGNWYYYDGRYKVLDDILLNYDPKKDNIHMLIGKLKAECNIEAYECTWDMFKRWTRNIIESIGKLAPSITTAYYGTLLLQMFI